MGADRGNSRTTTAFAEMELVRSILNGGYPPNTCLPSERELAQELGITRPTLRETLKKMERDGWIRIRHGKSTLVNDFWKTGGLNVLSAITAFQGSLPPELADYLLESRIAIAPHYTALAVKRAGMEVAEFADRGRELSEDCREYSRFDWELHHRLAELSGNPVYVFIINGFRQLYVHLAAGYFIHSRARELSLRFYGELAKSARDGDAEGAREVALDAMRRSREEWRRLRQGEGL